MKVAKSHRSPKGNRHMRRILNQCANAAVKTNNKEASSNSCIAASYYAWDTNGPFGQLSIGFVG
jgi:hypothetical protein